MIAVLGLAVFCADAWLVAGGMTESFDHAVDYWFYGLRNTVTVPVLIAITDWGNTVTVVAILLVLVILPRTRKTVGLPTTAAVIVSAVLFKVLKTIFARPRPDEALRLITQGGYSFPSGHSMNNLVLYGMLIYLIWRLCREEKDRKAARIVTVCLVILILAIGLSRIFVGVHYASDVIGGWSMGLCLLMTATVVWDRVMFRDSRDHSDGGRALRKGQ